MYENLSGTSTDTPGTSLTELFRVGSAGPQRGFWNLGHSQVGWYHHILQNYLFATVWVDDMFMGTALLAAWSRISGEVEHLQYAARQVPDMIE